MEEVHIISRTSTVCWSLL